MTFGIVRILGFPNQNSGKLHFAGFSNFRVQKPKFEQILIKNPFAPAIFSPKLNQIYQCGFTIEQTLLIRK